MKVVLKIPNTDFSGSNAPPSWMTSLTSSRRKRPLAPRRLCPLLCTGSKPLFGIGSCTLQNQLGQTKPEKSIFGILRTIL